MATRSMSTSVTLRTRHQALHYRLGAFMVCLPGLLWGIGRAEGANAGPAEVAAIVPEGHWAVLEPRAAERLLRGGGGLAPGRALSLQALQQARCRVAAAPTMQVIVGLPEEGMTGPVFLPQEALVKTIDSLPPDALSAMAGGAWVFTRELPEECRRVLREFRPNEEDPAPDPDAAHCVLGLELWSQVEVSLGDTLRNANEFGIWATGEPPARDLLVSSSLPGTGMSLLAPAASEIMVGAPSLGGVFDQLPLFGAAGCAVGLIQVSQQRLADALPDTRVGSTDGRLAMTLKALGSEMAEALSFPLRIDARYHQWILVSPGPSPSLADVVGALDAADLACRWVGDVAFITEASVPLDEAGQAMKRVLRTEFAAPLWTALWEHHTGEALAPEELAALSSGQPTVVASGNLARGLRERLRQRGARVWTGESGERSPEPNLPSTAVEASDIPVTVSGHLVVSMDLAYALEYVHGPVLGATVGEGGQTAAGAGVYRVIGAKGIGMEL